MVLISVVGLAQSYKICPICGTTAHRNAVLCSICGTSLTEVQTVAQDKREPRPKTAYDRRYGETDLLEGEVSRRGQVYLFGGLLTVALVLCVGVTLFVGRGLLNSPTPTPTQSRSTTVPIFGEGLVVTNTPRPTLLMVTVTPAPPTPSPVPTEGDCVQRVDAGDDLISMAMACGHRSMDVMPLILEMNDLDAPDLIQIGQEIIIPRPTATVDPNAFAPTSGSVEIAAAGATDPSGEANRPADAVALQDPLFQPTETLLPGVMWHQVQPDENMIQIAYAYNTNAEVLAQLNPQIQFSQCDYGLETGGSTCTVLLIVGQNVRVPAPTPTPTLSPTLSGSETATPTLTPTFNAPSLFNPQDRILFERDALITLRWVGSGTLGADEVYAVKMEDLTGGTTFVGETSELYFIVPTAWQGADGRRHDFRWSVSVIRRSAPDQPIFTTNTRLFTWESRND